MEIVLVRYLRWWDGVMGVLMTLVSVWPGQGQDKVTEVR